MNGQPRATLVAAASLCLTLTPLIGVFKGLAWVIPLLLTVAVVATAASFTRMAGRGQGLQTLAMVAALSLLMAALFNDGTAIALVIPTPGTFEHWMNLAASGVNDIVMQAPPVEAQDGILFLTMLGAGLVAILHDMFVVGLRTPALAGLTLLTMYLVPVSVAPEATAWFWFILPAVAYLWILGDDNLRRVSRFGHRFTGSGQLVGPRFPSPLANSARVAGAAFIAVTLSLLTVIPTNTSGLVDQVAQGLGDGPGQGEFGSLDPWAQLSGSLNQPEPIDVMRITTDNDKPGYLRMHVADSLSSEGFEPSGYADLDELESLSADDDEVYTATVENLELVDAVVPVYGQPSDVSLDGAWGVAPDTGVIASKGEATMEDVGTYTFEYTDPEWDAEQLAAASTMSVDDPGFERNTEHPSVPELSAIVEETMADATTVHAKTMAVMDYLSASNGFGYSLETEDAGNDEAILDFLETKQGYCQQYAAAMAWMLREADVPARVAIGTTKGELADGAWTVSSANFHAWVEVNYGELGWVPFDPTPSSSVANSVDFPWEREPAQDGQTDPQEPDEPDTEIDESSDPTEAPSGTDELDPEAQELPGAVNDEHDSDGANPGWLALLALLALPFAPALWRLGLRRRRLGPKRLSAATAWDETRDLAVDYGLSLNESLTPRQAAGVLGAAAPTGAAAAEALASAVEFDRYSGRGAAAAGLAAAADDLRSALHRAAPASRRFSARYWPASLARTAARQRQRLSGRWAVARARLPWVRRSNERGDGAVAGRP